MTAPLEVLAVALEEERVNPTDRDTRFLLLGYIVGREWPLDEKGLRRIVGHFDWKRFRRRQRKTAA